jgi:hypothetical protein
MRGIGKFLEVLILGELGGAMCRSGWKREGEMAYEEPGRVGNISREKAGERVCPRLMP